MVPPVPFWQLSLEALSMRLETTSEGLGVAEAARRLERYGPNEPRLERFEGLLAQTLRFLGNPLVLILLVAAGMSAAFGELFNAVLITALVAASVGLNYLQTYRSLRAAHALRHAVVVRSTLVRDGQLVTLPAAQVVPGDVFLLSAGDLVPADGRLIEAKDLFVDQAALTGESLPAEKHAGALEAGSAELVSATNAVFAGTSVISGTARVLAVHTGRDTFFGHVAAQLSTPPPPTEFERGMNAFAVLILRMVVALVLFVFLVLSLFRHEPIEAFLFSIALAVGLTPEFLPMIVTVTLARGALRMAKKQVIVKQLQAIENFGSIDVLCCDKTGTLTEGALALERAVDALGEPAAEVLEAAVLNSAYETGIRSPLDEAILRTPHPAPDPLRKLDEIPFDFHRRRLSVVLWRQQRRVLIVKGAPESVLEGCREFRLGGREQPLEGEARERVLRTLHGLRAEGFRTLAIAEREVPEQPSYEAGDECDLTLLGFLAFRDPPRADARETLEALRADGVRVVILTGDDELVTRSVCSAVGLDVRTLVRGRDLERVRGEALPRVVERVGIYARLTPEQKSQVILALKAAGHVVGYLGDGVNDAPSLRLADVGISVAGAVDVAREAAPIILLDKSLAVLHQGVLEGRRSFANVIKYLMMGTSSNFGNMFSMAAAAIFLPFLPMLPLQILLNNLIYDSSQLAIPADRVDDEAVRQPRRWSIAFIGQFMAVMGPVSSLFDLLTFALLLGFFHADQALFQTGWFVESLLTQTLVVFVIRTRQRPWLSRPSPGLVASVCLACAAAIALPFTPLGASLGMVPPPPALLGAIGLMTAGYLGAAELAKRLFYARQERSRLRPRAVRGS